MTKDKQANKKKNAAIANADILEVLNFTIVLMYAVTLFGHRHVVFIFPSTFLSLFTYKS